jgi:hypothetical protein
MDAKVIAYNVVALKICNGIMAIMYKRRPPR